ncbi:MAG: hypothetical protein F2819_02590, partial [Actinobacteria bacterium]|nr:hypothetical protein [Actinomycetota bacterium]
MSQTDSINLIETYKSPEPTKRVDERIDIFPNGILQSTGANLSIRSINGFPIEVSSFSFDSSDCGGLTYDLCLKQPINHAVYVAQFPPCGSSTQSDCISRLAVIDQNGNTEDAIPLKELPPNIEEWGYDTDVNGILKNVKTFNGDFAANYPSGGNRWIWKFPNYTHRGGSIFYPGVSFHSQANFKVGDEKNLVFRTPQVNIQLLPVSVDGPVCRFVGNGGCAYINPATQFDGAVYSRKDFTLKRDAYLNLDTFVLEFRSSIPWSSWTASTITDLDFSFKKSGKDFIYQISGKPGQIPEVLKNIPITPSNSSLIRSIAGANFNCPAGASSDSDCSAGIFLGGKGGVDKGGPNNSGPYQQLEELEKLTDGTSTFLRSYWIAQTQLGSNTDLAAACSNTYSKSVPVGISSSNSTLAQDEPPSWDSATKSFIYNVASFSKKPDGNKFVGHYSLLIPAELAKCLWKDGATQANLVLSVINSDGSNQLATTSVRVEKEWFKFNAAGFHFSSPKLVASAVNAKSISEPTGSTQLVPKTTKVITCKKGKISKKI